MTEITNGLSLLRRLKTSKIFLLLWLLLGAGLLVFSSLTLHELVLYALGLAAMVWNRIDSRGKAYKFSMHAPGGAGVTMESAQNGDEEE
jgi:hypothetical protein